MSFLRNPLSDFVVASWDEAQKVHMPCVLSLPVEQVWRLFGQGGPAATLQKELDFLTQVDNWDDLGFTRLRIPLIFNDATPIYGVPRWLITLCLCRNRDLSWMKLGWYGDAKNRDCPAFHPSEFDVKAWIDLGCEIRKQAEKLVAESRAAPLPPTDHAVDGPEGLPNLILGEHFSYDDSAFLGSGSFGIVYKGRMPLDAPHFNIAFKIFRGPKPSKEELEAFENEAKTHHFCRNENVVALRGLSKTGELGMVMDLLSMSLGHLLRSPFSCPAGARLSDPAAVVHLVYGVAKGVLYLHTPDGHKPRILHRDLKADNVLLSSDLGAVRVADFGLARLTTNQDSASSVRGTPLYMAPEIQWNKHRDANLASVKYDERVDVYCFGLLLWHLCTGSIPFSDLAQRLAKAAAAAGAPMNDAELDRAVAYAICFKNERPDVTQLLALNQPHVNLLVLLMQWCWHSNPALRPTMGMIVQVMSEAAAGPIDLDLLKKAVAKWFADQKDEAAQWTELAKVLQGSPK